MANENFLQLPTVTNAELTDVIAAVQGNVTVQETLQQVLNLVSSSVIQFSIGNPNGSVAGTIYNLCWDSTNHIMYVCTTTGNSATAVWTNLVAASLISGTNISITTTSSGTTISAAGASSITWSTVTSTSQVMVTNHGYVANNASLVTLTLPTTSGVGDVLQIAGIGGGGYSIAQNAGQNIIIGAAVSTMGVSGSVSSTNIYDSIDLRCVVANTTWQTLGAPQSSGLTVV